MKIAIGCDHRGFERKPRLIELMQSLGHEVIDQGTFTHDSVDYPDFAQAVALQVGRGQADRGLLMCGTGLGMCVAANKVRGVRAVAIHDIVTAELSRRHNDANVLCLSADLLGDDLIDKIIRIWLTTDFEGNRHARRVEKIAKIESDQNLPH